VSSQTKSGGIRAWTACVCLVALLLAASVETGHVCGALQASPETPAGASQWQASAGYCPICALAQPATVGSAPMTLAPAMSVTVAGPVLEPQHHSFHGLFALNVRPPPA
jgi:hypothetical protein